MIARLVLAALLLLAAPLSAQLPEPAPAEPAAGSVIVTQSAPDPSIVACTPPTNTLVIVPKPPFVIVIVFPPAPGPEDGVMPK